MLTDAQIQEGNRLIAEFMGATIFEMANMEYAQFNTSKQPWIKDLTYHMGWSSIMPVVEKIESLIIPPNTFTGWTYPEHAEVCIFGKCCYISVGDNFLNINQKGIVEPKEAILCVSDTKIEAVWNTIIHFITWYKNNKV